MILSISRLILEFSSKNMPNHEPKVLEGSLYTQTHQKSISKHFKLTFDLLWLIIFDFGKILVIFSKIFNFWKIPRNSKFPPNALILCFSRPKNTAEPNISARGVFVGSNTDFFDVSVENFEKIFKNVDFWSKYGQNQPIDVSMGLQTNSNELSTWKRIEIVYKIIFLAFSEV